MSPDPFAEEERRVAVRRWADEYTARVEHTFEAAWPDLAARLDEGVQGLSRWQLLRGPGAEFRAERVERPFQDWLRHHVEPVLCDARRSLQRLVPGREFAPQEGLPRIAGVGGQLEIGDTLQVLLAPGGMAVAGGAAYAAISTGTTWLVFSTVMVSWPVLVTGLLAGGVMMIFGGRGLGRLTHDLRERARQCVVAPMREAVIGEGVEHEGNLVPSLLRSLQTQIQQIAANINQDATP